VLILLDRNVDLTVMVRHSWTYQALVHDLLDTDLNRVCIETKEHPEGNQNHLSKVEKKIYDLDVTDPFWTTNAGLPFPEVAGENYFTRVRSQAL